MKKKKTIGTIILIILCLAVAGLIYCQQNSLLFFASDTAEQGGMPGGFPGRGNGGGATATVNVGVKDIVREDFVKSVIINGELTGDVTEKNVTSDISGKVTQILVSRGDKVKVGDPIAVVDPSTPGSTYKTRTVTSPVEGTVISVSTYVNQTITTQTALVTVGSPDSLILTMEVPERYYRYVNKGTEATFSTISYPDETEKAVVRYVGTSVDQNTRTVKVEMDLTTKNDHLLSGMFVRARLVTEKVENAIVVPTSAISTYLNDKVVYAVEDGKAVRKVVETGSYDDDNTVILSGISEGEKIITSGSVSDGSLVNVITEN